MFQGFVVGLDPGEDADEVRGRMCAGLAEMFDVGWRVQSDDDGVGRYLVPVSGLDVAPGRAWDAVYALKAEHGVEVRPDFWVARDREIDLDLLEDSEPEPADLLDAAEQVEAGWHLEALNILEARAQFPGAMGEGILIGHPDTGITDHPCLHGIIDRERARSFIDDSFDQGNVLTWPHGTGTASVLAGCALQGVEIGVAPRAKVVPLRVCKKPMVLNPRPIADAIRHATQSGCAVISISLGTLPSPALRQAVRDAVDRGVIIVAAAGNYTGRLAIYPAEYDEVISMGAYGPGFRRRGWASTASNIDFWGPGEQIFAAGWSKAVGTVTQGLVMLQSTWGTSYATACVAGIAAMWLSHHGWENVKQAVGAENVSSTFRECLRQSLTVHGYRTLRSPDALKVLQTPIDGLTEPPPPPEFDRWRSYLESLGIVDSTHEDIDASMRLARYVPEIHSAVESADVRPTSLSELLAAVQTGASTTLRTSVAAVREDWESAHA